MINKIRLKLRFDDRVGIVADISTILASSGIGIESMEVKITEGCAEVYLEIDVKENYPPSAEIMAMLGKTSGCREIGYIDVLPHKEKEYRSQVALDAISEGTFSIDKEGKITMINKAALRMLHLELENVIGQSVEKIGLPDNSILDCLMGRSFENVKQDMISDKGRALFFASGRPIRDNSGNITGAVEVIKDGKDIKTLARTITMPVGVTFSDFISRHRDIQRVILLAKKIAVTDSVVSLRGESGTGKELFAHAIHHESGRTGPFVPINCAAIPEHLLESELFGYVGGSFTGAKKEGQAGIFETANNGTVFLDEIADMPLVLQAKMLRLLQEMSVRRVGGTKEIPVNIRIITATNKNLEKLVEEKVFREDLYFRINIMPIFLPPLRKRPDDIPVLAEHFLFQFSEKLNQKTKMLSDGAIRKLLEHSWPGNIRELKSVIERAFILSDGDVIQEDHVYFGFESLNSENITVSDNKNLATMESLHGQLETMEKDIILKTLGETSSVRKAAKKLGISHTALLKKIKKFKDVV